MQICQSTVLEIRSPKPVSQSKCQQFWFLLEAVGDNLYFICSSFERLMTHLVYGQITKLSAFITTPPSHSALFLSCLLIRILVVSMGPPRLSRAIFSI